jgi:uncharacterized membrane protein
MKNTKKTSMGTRLLAFILLGAMVAGVVAGVVVYLIAAI